VIAVDTSALCAVVLGEPDAERYLSALEANAGDLVVGGPTVLEAEIVVTARQGPDAARDLHLLLDGVRASVVAFDDRHARLAMRAWTRFGRGRHSAALNLGDCMAYAVAASHGCALLYKGDDFAQTDLRAATEP
jgi:ribonuclease VapC